MQRELRQTICMENILEEAWVGAQVGLGRVRGNHQGSVNGVSQVDGDLDMLPTCVQMLGVGRDR